MLLLVRYGKKVRGVEFFVTRDEQVAVTVPVASDASHITAMFLAPPALSAWVAEVGGNPYYQVPNALSEKVLCLFDMNAQVFLREWFKHN